jgi:hypothetical protein
MPITLPAVLGVDLTVIVVAWYPALQQSVGHDPDAAVRR